MEQILVTRQYIQHSGAAYNRAAGELIDNFKKYLKKNYDTIPISSHV